MYWQGGCAAIPTLLQGQREHYQVNCAAPCDRKVWRNIYMSPRPFSDPLDTQSAVPPTASHARRSSGHQSSHRHPPSLFFPSFLLQFTHGDGVDYSAEPGVDYRCTIHRRIGSSHVRADSLPASRALLKPECPSSRLYGCTNVQMYLYFGNYPEDRALQKWTVRGLGRNLARTEPADNCRSKVFLLWYQAPGA